jgi:hypothetical protein
LIDIQVDDAVLTDGTAISGVTYDSGKGGTVAMKVADTLTLSNPKEIRPERPSGIFSNSQGKKEHAGNGGHLKIEARQIVYRNFQ